jgi:hypothetical protein
MNATEQHRLDCLVQHYADKIRPHIQALRGIRTPAERRAYIDAFSRKEGKAVGEALMHAYAADFAQRRA